MNHLPKLLMLAILIGSCNQKDETFVADEMEVSLEKMAPASRMMAEVSQQQMAEIPLQQMDVVENTPVNKKQIIKDGRMGIKVKELEKAKVRMDELTTKHGGYYGNERYNNTDYESSFNLQIRVPALNFEKLISDIESGEGEIMYKDLNARDVTDQFIDLETRLSNKRNYLSRYNDLLKLAKTVKDILEIEDKIRVLEEEIESTEGRLKYLRDQVSYSSLELTLTQLKEFVYKPDKPDKFLERLKQSLAKGWHGFVEFLLVLIRLWPFWILLGAILYSLKMIRKRKKKTL